MLRADSRRPALALLSVLTLSYAASPCEARPGVPTAGSSIAPTFSIRPDAVRPDAELTLLLCVTNENTSASRELARGDAFRFAFGDGLVVDCGDVSVFSPSAALSSADFTCAAEPDAVTLTYTGRTVAWPVGEAACARARYLTGSAPSTVATSLAVGNRGAWSPARPAAILLHVSPDGAGGGGGGIGQRVMAVTTGIVQPTVGDSMRYPVPGLDRSVTVAEGSNLLVLLDLHPKALEPDCPSFIRPGPGAEGTVIYLELDGVAAVTQVYGRGDDCGLPVTSGGWIFGWGGGEGTSWLSAPLTAGAHQVRVMVQACGDFRSYGACFGSATDDTNQGRMTLIELLR